MDDAKQELVQQWLLKASHDLIAARTLIERGPVVFDMAAYHCQQVAEKAVKAFLVFNDHDPDKTHDVDRLLDHAARFEPALAANRAAVKRVTPFATLYRYPGRVTDLSLDQVGEALKDALSIYEQVLKFLPTEVQPESD